ncbi:MAG TPA: hypothetical protein DCF33_20990, partial [Saprospirales bacterium]|nr:hypothetical protein [Saprospirales bacterium]
MSDSIKIFIQQHREAFDEALPGAHGWTGLARMLDRLPDADELEKTLMYNRILMDTEVHSEALWDKIEQELDQSGG